MTNPQVDAGRELDAKVAEEVFGWRWARLPAIGGAFLWHPDMGEPASGWVEGGSSWESEPDATYVPHYSTDIAAAWEVVEKLNEMGFYVTVARTTDGRSFCRLMESNNWVGDGIRAGPTTVPLAICRCALKAVRADTEGADG